MKLARFLPLAFATGAISSALTADAAIRLSEIQAENYNTLLDEEKDTGDWIEIQNTGDAEVDLTGWHLTDEKSDLSKWRFPQVAIPANGFIVVFADEKNRNGVSDPAKAAKAIHTNFRLSLEGEYLALVKPDGKTVEDHWQKYPTLIPTISYGIDSAGKPGYFKSPTPGVANGLGAPFGPYIEDVKNLTGQPDAVADQFMTIEAKVTKMESPIKSVTLFYRFQYKALPGPDGTLSTADDVKELTVPMLDDGVAPDKKAADGIFTGSLPINAAAGQTLLPGEMVRWRVEATDEQGTLNRLPLYHDPKDSDQYFGTVAKGTKGLIAGSETLPAPLEDSKLPIVHLFIEKPASAENTAGTRCSIFYLNEFYDNVRVDLHGQSTSGFPKKKPLNLDSNVHHRFKFKEGMARVKDMDLLTNYADKSKVRNHMAYEMYRLGGVPCHVAFPVRVQLNGAFHGTWDLLNDPDEEFLKDAGLNPEGALYKMYDALVTATQPNEKKTRIWEPRTDLQEHINGLRKLTPAAARTAYGWDNMNIAQHVNFICMNTIVNNTDFGHKNYYVYRDTTDTGIWHELPWDVDLSLGRLWTSTQNYFYDPIVFNQAIGNNNGNAPTDFVFNNADGKKMVYRRMRTLMDEFYGPPDGAPKSDYFMRKLAQMEDLIDPQNIEWSDAELDYKKNGTWSQSGNAVAKHTAAVAGVKDEMRKEVARIREEFYPKRREFLYKTAGIPKPQSADIKVDIKEAVYLPESGNQNEEYIMLENASAEDIDMTGWKLAGAIDYTFWPGTVLLTTSSTAPQRGKLYIVKDWRAFKARATSPKAGELLFVQGNYKGQLSARGETLRLVDGTGKVISEFKYEGKPSPEQDALRITEVMYAPAIQGDVDEGDYEYIELKNIGAETLILEGVTFVQGIEFTFPANVTLAAGAYGLLVKDKAAFESKYGAGKTILGEFKGRLNNGGERLELEDKRGENVLAFSYKKEWAKEAAESGHSLVIRDATKPYTSWDLPESWAASAKPGGTPGTADGDLPPPPPPAGGYANWRKKHFSEAEIGNEAVSGPSADANGDGQANLLAYAFNVSPKAADAAASPKLDLTGGYPALKYRRWKSAADLTYTVQVSADLKTWTSATQAAGASTSVDADTEWVAVRADQLTKDSTARYLRVNVSLKQ